MPSRHLVRLTNRKKNKEKVKVGDRWGPGVQTVDPASSEQREMENKVNRTQGEKKKSEPPGGWSERPFRTGVIRI